MSMPTIRREVADMLAQTNAQIAQAEAKLQGGTAAEKVRAAGELAFLRSQRDSIQARLAEVDARPESTETLYQWTREELFNLGLRLQDWFARL
jgi:hypothetical protein